MFLNTIFVYHSVCQLWIPTLLIKVTTAEIFSSLLNYFYLQLQFNAHTCQSRAHTLRFPVTSSLLKYHDLCSEWSLELRTLEFHKKSMFSFQILFFLQNQNRPVKEGSHTHQGRQKVKSTLCRHKHIKRWSQHRFSRAHLKNRLHEKIFKGRVLKERSGGAGLSRNMKCK